MTKLANTRTAVLMLALTMMSLTSLGVMHSAHATVYGQNSKLDARLTEARTLIDEASDDTRLSQAYMILVDILEADQAYSPAYVQMARAEMKLETPRFEGAFHLFTPGLIDHVAELLETAIALDENNAEAYILYGYVAGSMKRSVLGLAMLEKARALGSASPWLLLNKAQLLRQLKRSSESKKIYEDFVDSNNDVAKKVVALDGLLAISEDYQESIDLLKRWIALQPEKEYPRYQLAQLLWRHGDFDRALETVQAAMENGASHQDFYRLTALGLYGKAALAAAKLPISDEARDAFMLAQNTGLPAALAMIEAKALKDPMPVIVGLANLGVDIDAMDRSRETLLNQLITTLSPDDIALMIQLGAKVDHRGRSGSTPLAATASSGLPGHAEVLLTGGADPNIPLADGTTVLELAESRGRAEIVQLLIKHGATGKSDEGLAGLSSQDIEAGSPAAITAAVGHLQSVNAEDTKVIRAMQRALASDPMNVLSLLPTGSFLHNVLCSHPVDPNDEKSAILARLATVEAASDNNRPPLLFCKIALQKAANERKPVSLKGQSEEHRLAAAEKANKILDGGNYSIVELGSVRRISSELLAADRHSTEARLLDARLKLMGAEREFRAIGRPRYMAPFFNYAVSSTSIALQENPDNSSARLLMVQVLLEEGRTGAARTLLEQMTERQKQYPEWILRNADLAIEEDRSAAVRGQLEKLYSSTRNPRWRLDAGFLLADLQMRDPMPKLRKDIYDALVTQFPNNSFLLRSYGERLLAVGDFPRAISIGEKLNEIGEDVSHNHYFALAMHAEASNRVANGAEASDVAPLFKRALRQQRDLNQIVVAATRYESTMHIIDTLSSAGIDINKAGRNKKTSLRALVELNHTAGAARLLDLGADPSLEPSQQATLIELAIRNGNKQLLNLLLENGAPVVEYTSDGQHTTDLALEQQLDDSIDGLRNAIRNSGPTWESILLNASEAKPVGLSHAIRMLQRPEAQEALDNALINHSDAAIRYAGRTNQIPMLCRKRGSIERIRKIMKSLVETRLRYESMGLQPNMANIELCIAGFST